MELTNFNYNDHDVRTVTVEGEPGFIAADICRVLDIGNPSQALSYLDEDERGLITNETPSGVQAMAFVTESGLYSLILRSRKPEAKPFKRWVTHEVLPSIRKHGGYLTPATVEDILTDPDTLIRLATDLKNERSERLAAERREELAQAEIKELTPPANAWAQFLSSTGDLSVNEAAKALSRNSAHVLGERKLRALLEKWGWVYRDHKRRPRAYQTQIDNGRLAERARTYQDQLTGELVQAAPQVRVTAKGLDAARDLLSRMDR